MKRKNKRKKKKALSSKSIICITTIAMLNVMGVSYGAWNNGINTFTELSTGFMDVKFEEGKIIDQKTVKGKYRVAARSDDGKETVHTKEYSISDALDLVVKNKKIRIDGEVINDGEIRNVKVTIKNNGTIPVKLYRINGEKENEIIERNGTKTIRIPVQINPGNRNDYIKLEFTQIN